MRLISAVSGVQFPEPPLLTYLHLILNFFFSHIILTDIVYFSVKLYGGFMKTYTKWVLFTFFAALAAFILSPSFERLLTSTSYQGFRINIMYLSGTIGIILMSAAVIVSARISFINNMLGGLDKAYNFHKLSAGLGFLFGFIHYLISFTNKILIKAGILESSNSTNHLTGIILEIYKASYIFLEPAFIIMIVVFFIAAYRKIPYRIFQLTHKLIPVLYLFTAFHAFATIFRGGWVGTIGGVILHVFVIFGAVCAVITILQLTGIKHRYKGTVRNIKSIQNGIIEIQIETDNKLEYKAGQFVFLKFKFSFETHPFSIASYSNDNILTFYIKECGDYTNKLMENLKNGEHVRIEGPYGQFTFDDENSSQLWIAGGIGITPFIAALEYMSLNKNNKNITLILSSAGKSPFEDKLHTLCSKSNVKLITVDTDKEGMLSYNKIKQLAPDIIYSSIWFCGPYRFRRNVEKGLKADNISIKNIYYDSFTFR